VQGVLRQNQPGPLFIRQAPLHQRQIQIRIAPINLVAHDGVSHVRQVDAKLMLASRERAQAQEGEGGRVAVHHGRESFFHEEFGPRRLAVGPHAILDRHRAGKVASQRSINGAFIRGDMAMDDRQVLLPHGAGFPKAAQLARGRGIFRHNHQP
jgi:hypothetical protein